MATRWQVAVDCRGDNPEAIQKGILLAKTVGLPVVSADTFGAALKMLQVGTVQAIVSAADTREVGMNAFRHLSKLRLYRGDARSFLHAPIGLVLPNVSNGRFVMCDAGAWVDPDPIDLYCNALLGVLLAQHVLKIPAPRIGILTIGEENTKIRTIDAPVMEWLTQDGYRVSAVEPKDVVQGMVDVLVCTGREGNLMLKAFESGVAMMQTALHQEFQRGVLARIAGLIVKIIGRGAFARVKHRLDPRYFAGGIVAGLSHPIIICHGRSTSEDIVYAVRRTLDYLDCDLARKLHDGLSEALKKRRPELLLQSLPNQITAAQ